MNVDYVDLKELLNNIERMHKQIIDKLDVLSCDDEILTKEQAATFLNCDKQMIKKLKNEGRLKNFGRGSFLRYKKSELLDLRKIRYE